MLAPVVPQELHRAEVVFPDGALALVAVGRHFVQQRQVARLGEDGVGGVADPRGAVGVVLVGVGHVHARHAEGPRREAVAPLVLQRLLEHLDGPRRVDDAHARGVLAGVAVALEVEPRPVGHQVHLVLLPHAEEAVEVLIGRVHLEAAQASEVLLRQGGQLGIDLLGVGEGPLHLAGLGEVHDHAQDDVDPLGGARRELEVVLEGADQVLGAGDAVAQLALDHALRAGVVPLHAEEVVLGHVPAIGLHAGVHERAVALVDDRVGHVAEEEELVLGQVLGVQAAHVAVGHVHAVEHDVGDREEREVAGLLALVGDGDRPDLARFLPRHEEAELDADALVLGAQDGVAQAVAAGEVLVLGVAGEVARAPELARVVVAQVHVAGVFPHVLLAEEVGHHAVLALVERAAVHALPRARQVRGVPEEVEPVPRGVRGANDVFQPVRGEVAVLAHLPVSLVLPAVAGWLLRNGADSMVAIPGGINGLGNRLAATRGGAPI